jgi:hypothetical protein
MGLVRLGHGERGRGAAAPELEQMEDCKQFHDPQFEVNSFDRQPVPFALAPVEISML